MNEDELRAFLDSATVGGDDEPDDAAEAEHASDAPEAPVAVSDPLDLPPTEPIGIVDGSPAAAAGGARPSADPSFDELLGIRPDPAPVTAPDPAPGPRRTGAQVLPPAEPAEPELVPIVLPAPPSRPSTPAAPPRAAAQPPTTPLPAAPQSAQSQPAQPRTAQLQTPPPSDRISAAQLANDLGFDSMLTVDDGYERIEVTGGERDRPRFVPWIIVGAVAVIAIVASVLIVLSVRGAENPGTPTADPTNSTGAPTTPTSETPTPSDEPTSSETPTTPEGDAPKVDVGDQGKFPIAAWNLTGKISAKFGWPQYRIEDQGKTLILFGGSLLPQFPESCKEMREGFGLTRQADGTLEVYRPAETCAEAPELYDQVWGLTAATIPTFKKD